MEEFKSKSRIPMKTLLVLSPILPLLPFLLDYFDGQFASSMPFKLFTYSSERNYMFLFCNGILVFIIANSSAEGNSHLGSVPTLEQIKKNDNFERPTHSEIAVKFEMEKAGEGDYYIDKYPILEEEEEEETEEVGEGIGLHNEDEVAIDNKYPFAEEEETEEVVDDGIGLHIEDEEEEVAIDNKYPFAGEEEEEETEEVVDDGIGLHSEDEEEEEEEEVAIDNKYPFEEEETEEVVDDGIGLHNEDDEEVEDNKQNGKDEIELLSVDELNKIFEDFIRKMRKQIDNGRT